MNRSLRATIGAAIVTSTFLLGACGSSTDDDADTDTTTGATTGATTADSAAETETSE